MCRRILVISLALLAPLAAGASTNAFGTVQEFAREIALKPGNWHTRAKVIDARVESEPGADPASIAALRARIEPRIGKIDEMNECVERVPSALPRLPGILLERDCSFSRIEGGEGRWKVASSCSFNSGQGKAVTLAQGTYSRQTVTGRHEGQVRIDGAIVHLEAETVSRYTGKCRPEPPGLLHLAPGKD